MVSGVCSLTVLQFLRTSHNAVLNPTWGVGFVVTVHAEEALGHSELVLGGVDPHKHGHQLLSVSASLCTCITMLSRAKSKMRALH